MAMTVGELTAYLNVDDSDFNKKLDHGETEAKKVGRWGHLQATLGLDGSKYHAGLTSSQKKWASFSKAVDPKGFGRMAFTGATVGVLALGAGIGVATVAGLKYDSMLEQTTIAMGVMLGSTKKAKDLVDEVAVMAAKTPFQFPELADATKRLVAYGVAAKDAVPLMTRLGDVSSALGVPIGEMADLYGKMKVSGRITMEDINQMAGRGIPIYSALAKTLGVGEEKIRGMVEKGKVGFPDVEKAFQSMTDKGGIFSGMMDKQSSSFAGIMSTLQDTFTKLAGDALKPLFEWLTKTAFPALIEAGPRIGAAIGVVGKVVAGVFGVLGKVWDFFNNLPSGAKVFIIAFAAAVGTLLIALGALVTIAPMVASAMTFMTGPVGIIVMAIAGLIAVFVTLWVKCDWFREFWLGLWDILKNAAMAFWDWAGPTITAAAGAIWDAIKTTFDLVKGAFEFIWPYVKDIVKTEVDLIVGFVKGIITIVSWLKEHVWDPVQDKVEKVWPIISGVVKDEVKAIKGFIDGLKTIIGVIADIWDAIHKAAETAWGVATGIVGIVKTGIIAIKDLPGEFIERIKNAVGAVWTAIKTAAQTAWSGSDGNGGIVGVVKGAWNKIAGFINNILGAFNWVTNHVPGLTHTDYKLPTFGTGDDSRSGAEVAESNVMPGAMPGTGGDSRPARSGDVGDVLAALNPLDLIDKAPWPEVPEGLSVFSGIGKTMLELVKDAIKKAVQALFGVGGTGSGTAPVGGAGYAWAYALAKQFGLTVTSTYRPGAITASGNISDHGTYGRAADLAGALSGMANLWGYVKSTAGSWKQAIYQHQMVNYGSLGYYGPSDHFDHVHLARNMAKGGLVNRTTLARIGEAGPEAVIPLNDRRARAALGGGGRAGNTYVTMNVGRVYATNPAQAEAAGAQLMNAAIRRLAQAKRATNRSTP